jgi:two-component system chemotaxis response regulator CheB
MSVAAAAISPGLAEDRIRVMVVDDALVVRGLIARWVDAEPDMRVVASLRGGREAIEQVVCSRPDVVILDVTMPDIDGITALPRLLEKKRDLVVLMASTLTRRNAEVSLQALSLGAADYIPKPENNRELAGAAHFRRELIDKIRALGSPRRQRFSPASIARRAARDGVRAGAVHLDTPGSTESARFALRPFSSATPRVLLAGASTGGPQALNTIVGALGTIIEQVPVLITQHMPPAFTTILAEHLDRASGRSTVEATDGEPIRPGRVYVARGGRHMRVERRDAAPVIALDDGPPINFCKPAVDPLFSSAAQMWGASVLGLVLTGMGSDGTRGAAEIVAAGGSVIAQDEASSVVWGMPGSVANAGLASAVLSLDAIVRKVHRLFGGGAA